LPIIRICAVLVSGLPFGPIAVEDVGIRETLGPGELARGEHPHADVDDHIGDRVDRHGDDGEACLAGDCIGGRSWLAMSLPRRNI
jgi:hypothetical protein